MEFEERLADLKVSDNPDSALEIVDDTQKALQLHPSVAGEPRLSYKERFQQRTPLPSGLDGDLWRLPYKPYTRGLQPGDRRDIEYFYDHACFVIEKAWGCSVTQALPANMRAYTPYSMAFLLLFRWIAAQRKGMSLAEMQRLLAEVYKERKVKETEEEREFGLVKTKAVDFQKAFRQHSEEYILEHRNGLMLQDLKRVRELMEAPQKRRLQERRAHRDALKQARIRHQNHNVATTADAMEY